jgi:hypothetical protein
MRLVLRDNTAVLVEPTDTKALSVDVDLAEVSAARISELLDPWGVLEGEHVHLSIDTLRAAGHDEVVRSGADGHAWCEKFDAMIAFAGKHGWIDEAAGTVRAHVRDLGNSQTGTRS